MAEIEKHNQWVDDVLEEGEIDDSKKENEKLVCSVEACKGKAFTKQFALMRHWAEIHEENVNLFECGGCTRLFRRAADVKRHALQKHNAEMKAVPGKEPVLCGSRELTTSCWLPEEGGAHSTEKSNGICSCGGQG